MLEELRWIINPAAHALRSVAEALDEVGAPREQAGGELTLAGRVRALGHTLAGQDAEVTRYAGRSERLEDALRDAPMPLRESTHDLDAWHEAYDAWWHARASEDALQRPPEAFGIGDRVQPADPLDPGWLSDLTVVDVSTFVVVYDAAVGGERDYRPEQLRRIG